MDNASTHHVENVHELIENQAGIKLMYLPPYYPAPVEEAFSQIKSIMEENDLLFQVFDIPRILLTIDNGLWHGYYRRYIKHSGYY